MSTCFFYRYLVSRHGQIPPSSPIYEGNRVDSKSFPDSLTRIRNRLEKLSLSLEDVTLVYDKGNLSKKNQALVANAPLSYASILRSKEGLNKSRQNLLNLEARLEDMSLSEEAISTCYFKVRNMIQSGKLVIYSALSRKQCLGPHYREDFPPDLPTPV